MTCTPHTYTHQDSVGDLFIGADAVSVTGVRNTNLRNDFKVLERF